MVSHRERISSLVALAAALWLLALPVSSALATDRFVDDQGLGDFPCTNPLDPCASIVTALNVPSVSGDVIHVGGGSYPGNLTLPDGVSLIRHSFASGAGITTTGTATINTLGSTNPAIAFTTGTSSRIVSGFTLRGGNTAGLATLTVPAPSDNVTISGNTFDDHSANVLRQLRITSGSPRITGNTFLGTPDSTERVAIAYAAGIAGGGSPEIDHNAIDGLFGGIQVVGDPSPPTIFDVHDNAITNLYDPGTLAIPIAISTLGASGTLTGNLATQIPNQGLGDGITTQGAIGTGVPLVVSHNQTYGFEGPSHFAAADPVVLTDDVFSGVDASLALFNSVGATIRNVTAINTGGGAISDIALSDSPGATIDSSFVGSHGITSFGTTTCASSFSASTAASPGCGLSTVGDPLFASIAGTDFHLLAGSPLIDAGNPAAPDPGETDLDGNPRAVAVNLCPARRDIGAYELNTPRDCTPAPATTAPDTTVSGKRKIKTRKKKARVTWTFASTEPGATFACSLDGAPFAPCTSPFSKKLRRGAHTLAVRASDASGNVDPTPASFTTKVKRKRPRR